MDPNKEQQTGSGFHWKLAARLGFWFFFLKGMLWLIVPALAVWFGWEVTHRE